MKNTTQHTDPPNITQPEQNKGHFNPICEYYFPIRIVSYQNAGKHWAARYRDNKKIIEDLTFLWKSYNPPFVNLYSTITITRISPRLLESHDNLPYSFKSVVDCLANIMYPSLTPGRADAFFHWKYAQEKVPKTYAFKVKIDQSLFYE